GVIGTGAVLTKWRYEGRSSFLVPPPTRGRSKNVNFLLKVARSAVSLMTIGKLDRKLRGGIIKNRSNQVEKRGAACRRAGRIVTVKRRSARHRLFPWRDTIDHGGLHMTTNRPWNVTSFTKR
ncbi:unnamed protein product, partial [Nesidiocoris tenuis]